MQTSQDSSLIKKPRRGGTDASKRAMEFVNLTRGRVLTEGERLDILALHANLRAEATAIPKKESVTAKISRLLGRSNKTVGAIWSDFESHGSIFVVDPPANRSERATKIPRSHEMRESVQAFIRNRCESRIRTTCKDVMHFLVERQFLRIELTDSAQVKTAQQQVQRFVKDAGYCRGEHNTSVLRLSPLNSVKRAEYVQLMTAINIMERRIVYMDESYIHQHYSRHADSLYDPSDQNSVKSKHKGRRLCFAAAIIDHDRSVHGSERTVEQQAGLLLDTVDVFEGGKQIKDYHGMFNHEYFVKWMETLLLCLKRRGIANCVIVMDDAKYHKVLPASTPKKATRKMCYYLCASNTLLSEHITKYVVPVVVEMARAHGHDVVFTPPHHSNLQPIEIVWAIVKGEVGRQYTTNTTFEDIRVRLDKAFQNLQPSTVQGCIDAATKQLLALKAHLEAMDSQGESSESDGDSNEHSNFESELE